MKEIRLSNPKQHFILDNRTNLPLCFTKDDPTISPIRIDATEISQLNHNDSEPWQRLIGGHLRSIYPRFQNIRFQLNRRWDTTAVLRG